MSRFKEAVTALTVLGAVGACSAELPSDSPSSKAIERVIEAPAAPTPEIKIGDGGAYLKDPQRSELILTGLQATSRKLIAATANESVHCSPTLFETGEDYNANQKLPAGQVCDVRKLAVRPSDSYNIDRGSSYIFTNNKGEYNLGAIQEASAESAACGANLYLSPLGEWEVEYREGGQSMRSGGIENNVADIKAVDDLALLCFKNTVDGLTN